LQVVRANPFKECYIRPLVFTTTAGWNLQLRGTPVSVGIACWEWNAYLGDQARLKGIRANVSSFIRNHPNATLNKAKIAGNYVNSTLAKTESVRLGFDEAILLDHNGYVAECSGQNIFIVRDGTIITPPKTTVLEGITRDSVILLAGEAGLPVEEDMLTRDQLYIADEVFVVGTATEVVGLREIDGRAIGNGAVGPVTQQLQEIYTKATHGELERHREWLTPV
jgi:branched-chain amino acid aminotransferase